MEHIRDVAHYLDAAAYRLRGEGGARPAFGHAPFITISRQVGAGGHALARAVLEAFARRGGRELEGWAIFDQELFKMVAEDPLLKVSMKYLLDEEYHSRMTDYVEELLGGWTPQDVLQAKIFRSVRALCGAGKIIVVGRAGACVTGDLRGGVHVRLAAGVDRRLKTVMRKSGLDERRARRRLDDLDEARRMLVRVYFRRDIDDPLLYDAVFNEDRLPTAEIADWIAGEVEKKAHLLERAAGRTRSAGNA